MLSNVRLWFTLKHIRNILWQIYGKRYGQKNLTFPGQVQLMNVVGCDVGLKQLFP